MPLVAMPAFAVESAALADDAEAERAKYVRMWDVAAYRGCSPGQRVYADFLARAAVGEGDGVIDFGCGTGRAALDVRRATGADVVLIDITSNSLDPEVRAALGPGFRFQSACLWDLPPEVMALRAKYGFCTDVMEHLPRHCVDAALQNIFAAVESCYFQIYTEEDPWGAQIGETLHLTCRSFAWWRERLSRYGTVLHAEDNGVTVIFYVRR